PRAVRLRAARSTCARRRRGGSPNVLGPRDRCAGGDLSRRGLAHGGDEVLDGRFVAPAPYELARPCAHPAPKLGIGDEPLQNGGGRGDVFRRDEKAVFAGAQGVVTGAAPAGTDER